MGTYLHKEEWIRHGEGFRVSVSRHTSCEENRWCVYAYVYESHPLFNSITDGDYYNSIYEDKLHGGCTYYREHSGGCGGVVKQFGADYNHLGDSRFHSFSTKEEAFEVFRDCDLLFDWLTEEGI